MTPVIWWKRDFKLDDFDILDCAWTVLITCSGTCTWQPCWHLNPKDISTRVSLKISSLSQRGALPNNQRSPARHQPKQTTAAPQLRFAL